MNYSQNMQSSMLSRECDIFQCSRTKHPFQGTIVDSINAFINVLRLSNDMELDIWQRALIFLPTLKHNSLM